MTPLSLSPIGALGAAAPPLADAGGWSADPAWLLAVSVLLVLGILVATLRKTLGLFSRKALLEKLAPGERERYSAYFERLEDYSVTLRVIDQIARMTLVASSMFAFASLLRTDGSAPGFLRSIPVALLVLVIVLSAVIIALELVPSVLARMSPEGLMARSLPALEAIQCLTAPMIRIYERVVARVSNAVGSQPPREPAAVVQEEILTAVEEGEREGVLLKSELSMIEAIIRFRDRSVSEVLTPRTEIVALEIGTAIPECVRVAQDCGHSRIPVYRDNKDAIVGILYVKDLLKFWDERDDEFRLEDVIRKAHFVTETKKVSELFQEFKTQRFHIAIVQDEFGGTSGLITIEDIVEDILGEIEEEFHSGDEPQRLVRLRDDLFEIDARFPVDEFNAELGAELSVHIPEDGGVETLGGFLFSSMGKLPEPGETHRFGPLRFEVLEADERMVKRLRIQVDKTSAEAARGS
jgi:CBS domain containing-hemolysin-like protein